MPGSVASGTLCILLTVHLDVILVNDQLDVLFLSVFTLCLYMFRATSAHYQEDQLLLTHHQSFLLTGTSDSHSPECVIPDDVLIQAGPPDDEHLLLETCRGIKQIQ
jgi:hypothetical protein